MKHDFYIISVLRVKGVSRVRMLSYIRDAVSNWGGQFEPGVDPLGPPCELNKRGAVRVIASPRSLYKYHFGYE